MDFSKYKFFYVNGTSHSEGGGLEEPAIRTKSILPIYKKIHNVEWNSRAEVNYGKRLEQILGITCINEAISGGGLSRVVRTTYDFIFKNWNDKDKFFIILEKPDASISEVFYTKTNKYYVVNSAYKKNRKKLEFENATREYFNKKYLNDKNEQTQFKNWFDNHFDFEQNFLESEKEFIGLYSFCKLHSIKIFIMQPNDFLFKECFDLNDIIKLSNKNEYSSIKEWCYDNNLSILHEINGYSNDNHPGYFGHIEYAKQLAKYIGWKGDVNIFNTKPKNLI